MITKKLAELKKDAVGDLKLAYSFEFQNFKKEHDKLISNPGCGICIRGFFGSIRKDPDVDQKLAAIYGEEVTHDLENLRYSNKSVQETIKVPVADWEKWYSSRFGVEDTTTLPRIHTAIRIGDNVVVNLTAIEKIDLDAQEAK